MNQLGRFGRHAPVAVRIFGDDIILHCGRFHVPHPFLHCRIVQTNGLIVAVLMIQHIGDGEECRRPSDIIVINGPVARRYHRDAAFRAHGIFYVLQPLVIHARVIQEISFSVRAGHPVSHPA